MRRLVMSIINIDVYKLLIPVTAACMLASCDAPAEPAEERVPSGKEPVLEVHAPVKEPGLPASDENRIEKVYGWLDGETLLYGVKEKGTDSTQIMAWNFAEEKGRIFYQPQGQVAAVSISPKQSHVLIHSAETADKASLDILDRDGNELYSVIIPSVELSYEWNIYQPGVLYLSSFNKEWSFTSYVVDAAEKSVEPIEVDQPFPQWGGPDELWYLDWKGGNPSLKAPWIKTDVGKDKKECILLDVIYFRKMESHFMTIQDESEGHNQAVYSFYKDNGELLSAFKVPHLKNFSDWLIPYFAADEKNSKLLTFVPEKAGMADQYNGTFHLNSFDFSSGKKEDVMGGLSNEPISCAAGGRWCLYGFQFEKVIDLEKKKIKSLFKAPEG